MKERVLGQTTVSSQNQITLVKEVLPFLEVKAGDEIEFVLNNEEIIIRKVKKHV
jgi:AbrB family looped-hinge helix DNA binding protein